MTDHERLVLRRRATLVGVPMLLAVALWMLIAHPLSLHRYGADGVCGAIEDGLRRCTANDGGVAAVLYLDPPVRTIQMGEPSSAPVEGTASEGDDLDRDGIARLQRRLNMLGLNAGPDDGMIGPGTRNAIRVYQERQGLPIDGHASHEVLDTLE